MKPGFHLTEASIASNGRSALKAKLVISLSEERN